MRPSHLLATALAFSSFSSAWLDVLGESKALAAGLEGLIRPRQDDSDSKTAASSAAPKTAAKSTPEPTATGSQKDDSEPTAAASGTAKETAKETGKETGKETAKETGKATNTKDKATGTKTTGKPKTTEFDARLPAGGVSMITPNALAGSQYYKIGDWVTFAWNYTSLSVTPTAIDILATCTTNKATYTLAVNQTVEETGMVLWDTGAYQASNTQKLLTATYTLLIYDADSSVSATAKAGYLGVYNQFTFGMYVPQSYTPWADFKCPTCNSGGRLSPDESQTLGFLLMMGTITVLSFTWFASGFGLF